MRVFKKPLINMINSIHALQETISSRSPRRIARQRKLRTMAQTKQSFVAKMPGNGCKMLITPNSFFAQKYVVGSYELSLCRYLTNTIHPGMVCVDVGANVGYLTLLMAKLVGPQGHIVSFEPTRLTYDELVQNVTLNGYGQVTASCLALSDYAGALSFNIGPQGYDVYNSAGEVNHPSAKGKVFTKVQVPCVSLDAYATENHLMQIDFIKIDAEGSELSVLKGMEQILATNPKMRIAIELADITTSSLGYEANEIVNWLQQRDWHIKVITSHGRLANAPQMSYWSGQMVVASMQHDGGGQKL